ncbi:MAG: carbohydrate binding domain-containing protein [Thermoguttaceae bacterium]|nr:carbohydrate binding domain-containing protein [Thermoguttaceae bacterium]MDW8079062.1 carbohydrate binding domain-containing protein [Thermoguttaceae bacterium]
MGYDRLICSSLGQKLTKSFRLLMLACLVGWLGAGVLAGSGLQAADQTYPDRFVWIFGWNLTRPTDVAEIQAVLKDAAQGGLNGAVFSLGMDSLCKKQPVYFERLAELQATCKDLNLEFIPAVFSIGYGGGFLVHNRHLAEGFLVEDALFEVSGSEARYVPDSEAKLVNGGFEEYRGNQLQGYRFHDQPGVVSFVDTVVFRSGKASLRMENFQANPHGHGRVMQEIKVRPRRQYRVSLWVKTENLQPEGCFRMTVLADGRNLSPQEFSIAPTSDWQKVVMVFNSLHYETVRLYAGVWGGRSGRFWLDDWSLEEIGPMNVLNRPGTPVIVRSEDGKITYGEGRDYAPLRDSQLNFNWLDRPAPTLKILPGGRIRPGQRLRVTYYHGMSINRGQVTVCMAEPEIYEIVDHEAQLLAKYVRPRRVLLNMDEIRMGGSCAACRGKDMAQLLGQCITRHVEILRKHIPGLQVYMWSDMFDPNHNAHADYYLVEGDFTGSWKYIPKDIVIAVWGGRPRPESLRFFEGEGFRTLVACYYDADDLEDVKGWLELARSTKGVQGFMYTPWTKKYGLLRDFGKLISSASR